MYLPDIPVSVAFGGLVAASNLGRLRSGQWNRHDLRRKSLFQVLVFGLLFHCPASITAFVWYPDWNLGYLAPFEKVGWPLALLMEAGLLLLLLLGCWLALACAEKRPALAWAPIILSLAAFAAVMALIWDQYTHVGTYEQYHRGAARLASSDPTFQMFTTLAGMYLLVPLAVLLIKNFLGNRTE
jgi:hypothetical protein